MTRKAAVKEAPKVELRIYEEHEFNVEQPAVRAFAVRAPNGGGVLRDTPCWLHLEPEWVESIRSDQDSDTWLVTWRLPGQTEPGCYEATVDAETARQVNILSREVDVPAEATLPGGPDSDIQLPADGEASESLDSRARFSPSDEGAKPEAARNGRGGIGADPQIGLFDVVLDGEQYEQLYPIVSEYLEARDAAKEPNKRVRDARKELEDKLPKSIVEGKRIRIGEWYVDGTMVERNIPTAFTREDRFQYKIKRVDV